MIVKIKDVDLAWLAGVLEGDGYFGVTKGCFMHPIISLRMIDKDTVERVADIFNEPLVGCSARLGKPHWSPVHAVSTQGKAAMAIMEKILPFMGERRGCKISSITSNYNLKLKQINQQKIQIPLTKSSRKFSLKVSVKSSQELIDLYYLAGLLEAEGSFMKGSPSSPNCPKVVIQMTDEDIIKKVSNMFGFKYYSYQRKGLCKAPPYKKVFIFSIKSASAAALMKKVYPIMSVRRQKQIDSALLSYDADLRKNMVNHKTKIFKKDFETIKKMRANGMSLRAIAEKFNVDHKTVRLTIRDRINK